MKLIYNIGIYIAHFVLGGLSICNTKIKKGITGRKQSFKILESFLGPDDKTLWFHCASLGEFEQGLPVFQKLRAHYRSHKVVLTFFSPSGYEIRKNTQVADIVVYLPLDTTRNATRFVNLVSPELTVFVKYDIWPNYLNALKKNQCKAILISALFRDNQIYFTWYGAMFRRSLLAFEHIFTQNESSKQLLNSIGYHSVTVSGDTRYDRVCAQLKANNTLNFIEQFKNGHTCVVVGSSWPEDEALFVNYINNNLHKPLKYIVAPHNIKKPQIHDFASKLNIETLLYSEFDGKPLETYQVLIIDTIGLLSKIYKYADIAYVGGAMGNTGLHNTLEPAVFGVPIIIGHNYEKFPEAKALIHNGGMFSVSNQKDFNTILDRLITETEYRKTSGQQNASFVKENSGAVIQILKHLRI